MFTVVGVVKDVLERGYQQGAKPGVYVTQAQGPRFFPTVNLMVRVDSDPLGYAPAIQRIVRAVDPDQPIRLTRTMTEVIALTVGDRRQQTTLLVVFGALAIVIASLGLYGLLAQTVSARSREIGIRMALGATFRSVMRMVMSRGIALTGARRGHWCRAGVVGHARHGDAALWCGRGRSADVCAGRRAARRRVGRGVRDSGRARGSRRSHARLARPIGTTSRPRLRHTSQTRDNRLLHYANLVHLDNLACWPYTDSMSTVDDLSDRLEFLQGTLEVLILRSLALGPNHAYGVSQFLKRESEEAFVVDNGSLYPALQRLLQRKWIAGQWKTSPNARRAKYLPSHGRGPETARGGHVEVGAICRGDGSGPRPGAVTDMREWWSRLRMAFRRRNLDEDLRAEIESHLQMEVDARIDRGMSPTEAVDGARRQFGNRTSIRDVAREAWRFHRLESIVQDVRYGLRVLRRSPGFTIVATLVIALGIGAVTSTFTLLDHVLLRPLPFAEPERLVLLHETNLAEGGSRDLVSPPNFVDWRMSGRSFESMGAYLSANLPVNLSGQGAPVRLESTLVEVELFKTLGVQPAAGRAFTSEDGGPDGARVVVLSHALALTLFGNPPAAVGRTLSLDHQGYTVIGVMPPSFVFPRAETALWRPLRVTAPALMANRSNHILFAIGRLRAGVSLESARSEMELIAGQLQRAYPKDNAKSGIGVIDLRDLMSPQARTMVVGVFGAALCLMLIACTNLANLLFARAVVRKPEMAIRVAAGAARGRLVRQLLTESLVLAGMGGVSGSLLAMASTPLFARLAPNGLPIDGAPEVDLRVLAFAAFVTLLTSVLFGVGPALRSCRRPDLQALRSRTASGGNTDRLRAGLVLAEVAGCVILLVGTGLLLKALWRVQGVDPGFRAEDVLTLRTALPIPRYSEPDARRDFYSRILTNVRALPGVTSAAYVSYHPMEPFSGRFQVLAPGVADDPLTAPGGVVHFVTPGYFATLGIPLRRGRAIDERDDQMAPQVVVISESLAERLWPGQDPIGRAVKVAGDRTVVGVVGNIVVRSLEGPESMQVYFPSEQLGTTSTYCAAGSSDPYLRRSLHARLRRATHHSRRGSGASHLRSAAARGYRRRSESRRVATN